MKHTIALMLLVTSLAACARENPSAPAAASPAASSVAATPAAPVAVTPAHSPGDLVAAAATQQEGADTGAAADNGESALERIAALPREGQLPAGKWVPGTNYKVIAPAQPTDVSPGKVEVLEMFWYACPHCYALDGLIESWRKNKAPYIDFTRVPVTWDEVHRAHARLFYTLQALHQLDALHSRVFEEIHVKGDPLFVQGDEAGTQREDVQFARANGIDGAEFLKAYNSFAVETDLEKADDLVRRYKIEAVPTFVIDGKYSTDVAQAGGQERLIQLINDLAASEKQH
ncbi:MAG: thiol:disulfide interchange protein DsbA/DsbL [Steroidobacteraceae bacterium]|jgi:thiol:disulfide interchange protein DsbA